MNKLNIEKLPEKLKSCSSIIGKENYFNSAVLVPLLKVNEEYHLLFQKRAANIRQGGEICFPGGEVDNTLDKNPVDTALRETEEEIGVGREKVNVLGQMNMYVAPMGVTVDPVVGILGINDVSQCKIDEREVETVFTVPLKFLLENEPEIYSSRIILEPSYIDENGKKIELLPVKALKLPAKYAERRITKNVKVYVYKYENEVIWGITAAIIFELVGILNKK